MVTSSVITVDLIANTIVNTYVLNNVTANNLSLTSNQIVFDIRALSSMDLTDFKILTKQLNVFQVAMAQNFPTLNTLLTTTYGAVEYKFVNKEPPAIRIINYSFKAQVAGVLLDIDNFSFDTGTKLISITARTSQITTTYSAFMFHLLMIDKFIQEISTY